ncbi:hypothetical protein ACIBO2_02725 [Nonomuraea sp. NPDC050022]|uniref:hypothetical protein n=1 Tax=unclassified Nonomuraea TaxID=2593643 RepID=UPI0033E439C8
MPGLVVLTVTALVAAIACALTLATGVSWPTALLSGGAAGGITLGILPKLLTEPRDGDDE